MYQFYFDGKFLIKNFSTPLLDEFIRWKVIATCRATVTNLGGREEYSGAIDPPFLSPFYIIRGFFFAFLRFFASHSPFARKTARKVPCMRYLYVT